MPYICIATPFGQLTVFADGDALVAVEWGRAPAPETDETPLLRAAREQLEAYCDGTLRRFTLPLVPAGTPFQQRVWSRLRAIPYGACASYGALARELGTAPRALAGACASNPLPILIPCHRVVGARGGLGGYSGGDGIETKRALLRLEGTIPAPGATAAAADGTAWEERR
ncbi:MAG: methylated-DNA--[protein]-cysteine S-methyltransferase [Rhodospirillales bacterium]